MTLKNGILTFNMTSDKTKVVADEFNSYIVKLAGTATADVLALDTEDTFGDSNSSEGVALAAGDYAVVIVDSNGYATDLYVVDVA